MNDPNLAQERRKAVKEAKQNGVEKDEARSWVRDEYDGQFEGHLLQETIDFIYDL
jgi:hypothetical protein